MTGQLTFWAQALDNASPDHIDRNGTEVPPDDAARRQEAVSVISNVIRTGTRIFDDGGVQLTEDGFHFVVEVPSAERDRVGRVAPIICYGAYDALVVEALASSVVDELEAFAKRIDRNVLTAHSDLARRSFVRLKKESSKRKMVRGIGALTVALVVLTLVYWLSSKGMLTR